MFEKSSSPSRRTVLIGSAAAGAATLFPARSTIAAGEGNERTALRPFSVHVPEAELVDLRRRIAATRWPDRETVKDQSQGIRLAKLTPLVEYWGAGYDWRNAEAVKSVAVGDLPPGWRRLPRRIESDVPAFYIGLGDQCSTTTGGAFVWRRDRFA